MYEETAGDFTAAEDACERADRARVLVVANKKGGTAKSAAPSEEASNASPPITRPIAQIQIELDNNRTTLEKLHHANAIAIAAVVQGNQQIESALKTEAALLGELEAAVKLQREQAEKARAALAALT